MNGAIWSLAVYQNWCIRNDFFENRSSTPFPPVLELRCWSQAWRADCDKAPLDPVRIPPCAQLETPTCGLQLQIHCEIDLPLLREKRLKRHSFLPSFVIHLTPFAIQNGV